MFPEVPSAYPAKKVRSQKNLCFVNKKNINKSHLVRLEPTTIQSDCHCTPTTTQDLSKNRNHIENP